MALNFKIVLLNAVLVVGTAANCTPTRDVVERVPVYTSDEQKQIDEVAQQVHDSTKWGQGETKPWKERYLGEEPNLPYQRPANPRELQIENKPKFEVDE